MAVVLSISFLGLVLELGVIAVSWMVSCVIMVGGVVDCCIACGMVGCLIEVARVVLLILNSA